MSPVPTPASLERRLVPTEGGFRLEGSDGSLVVASLAGDAWRLAREGGDWEMRREGRCLVLRDGEGQERARWTSEEPDGTGVAGSILSEDGRLFRIVLRGGAEPAVELTGWEVEGAYWVARPGDRAWTLARTPAGSELDDPDAALETAFAAALADTGR